MHTLLQTEAAGLGGSHHGVLVVYCPLAAPVGLQLVVRVPLGKDGIVGVGVPEEGPPPHGFAPSQRRGRRFGRELAMLRLADGAGGGVAGACGGAGGGGLAGAAGQAAVSQAGLRAPTVERERDEQSA